jgi:signal transduction histidine kinase
LSTHLHIDVEFDALASCIADGIAFVSAEGLVAAWSSGAAAITGIARVDAIGHALDELFSRIVPELSLALVPEQIELWTRDEKRRILQAMTLSIDDGWLLSFGREFRFAAIEQLKNEIVAAVSHELKTPIATIKAFATTLRQNPDAIADRSEFLATIEEQADRLTRAVDDLLMVGRVESKHLLRTRERVLLDRLIDATAARLGPTVSARIQRRSTEIELNVDPALLGDALAHLIDNALKFSADTAPVVIEGSTDGGEVTVRIIDRGIGIADDEIPYIFERFYRVDRNLTASIGGNGLGLTIAREIVQAHGGTITIESAVHAGSTVIVTLPLRAGYEADSP